MPGMPYQLEKGTPFSVLEGLAEDQAKLLLARNQLRAGVDVTALQIFADLRKGPAGDPTAHLNRDWFGMGQDTSGNWTRPARKSPPTKTVRGIGTVVDGTFPQTGLWSLWSGEAEAIFRETFCRAAEVALGLDNDPTNEQVTRCWPIEIFWKCQGPWFEGWVTWRAQPVDPAQGQVTVILATPGNGSRLWQSPRPTGGGGPDYDGNPTGAGGDTHGMWVITHEYEERYVAATSIPSTKGNGQIPIWGTAFYGTGNIIVVRPAETDGGVLSGGRP